MMYERTIAQKADELIDRVDTAVNHARAQALDRYDRTNDEFLARIETGTYIIAAAIVAGFIASALILRTAGS